MEKFIIAADTALRISDTQRGDQVVLLLHGYLGTLDVWDDFTSLLAPRFRVIAMDLPGHGVSQVKGEVHTMEFLADVVNGVLQRQEVDKCVIVGHSMGGYVAQAFAAKYSHKLNGLVLFHSTPNADTDIKREERRREIDLAKAGKLDLLAKMFAPNGFASANRARMSNEIEMIEELASICDEDGVVAILNGMMERYDSNDMLRELAVDQLFIFGRQDGFISVEVAEKIAQEHPQAKIEWLEESAHMGFLEQPQRSAEIITDFLRFETKE